MKHDDYYMNRKKKFPGDPSLPPDGRKAVILLSGGIDSAFAAVLAQRGGWELFPLFVDYRQIAADVERDCAARVAESLGVGLRVWDIDISSANRLVSGMTSPPLYEDADRSADYVPGRNGVLLSMALSYSTELSAQAIMIGATVNDQVAFPDCRPEYFRAFEAMAELGEGRKVSVISPAMYMRKIDIVYALDQMGFDLSMTSSCYRPVSGVACGECGSCMERQVAIDARATAPKSPL